MGKMNVVKAKVSYALIYYLSIIGFFGIFSTTISKNPVLPLFVHSLGGSDAILGLIAAISPLAGIIFSFPVGLMADKIGPKKLLIVSGIVFLLSPLLYMFVSNPYWLIPVRFFHGLATAILGPIASTLIVKKYSDRKGEMIGYYSSATLVGRTLAPIFGGMIISFFVNSPTLFGFDYVNYRLVYLVAFIASLPVIFLILSLKNDRIQSEKEKKSNTANNFVVDFVNSLKYFVSDRRMLVTAFVEMAIFFSFGVLETYLPIYLHNLNYSASQIGLIFSLQILSIALSKPLFGKLSDNIDRRYQIVFGLVVIGGCIYSISFVSSFVYLILLSLLFGLGLSFATVATSSYIGDIAKKDKMGASLGALSSIMDIGQSGGPLITGIIITYFSFRAGFLISFILCVIVSIVFLFVVFGKEIELVNKRRRQILKR